MTQGQHFMAVLAAARRGEDWAWDRLYADLAPTVYGYLRSQGAPNPEDVTSEVFLRLVRDLDSFRGDESGFRSWVFTITHAKMIDARRARSRRPSSPAETDLLDRHLPVVEVEADAVDSLVTGELRDMFEALTADQRDVLLLRIVAGLTVRETAHVVGKQPGAVKALQRRGLASLRDRLSELPEPLAGLAVVSEAS